MEKPTITSDQEYAMMQELYDPEAADTSATHQPNQESMVWDETRSSYTWTDPTGLVYLWNERNESWVMEAMAATLPKADGDLSYLDNLDEDFKLDSDDEEKIDWKRIKKEKKEKEEKRELERKAREKRKLEEGNNDVEDNGEPKRKRKKNRKKRIISSVYVKGLPLDATVEEMVEFFKKAGLIARDPYNMEYKVKLYENEKGERQGDGLVTFLKPLALESAFALLDGADFRLGVGFPISLEIPTFDNTKKASNGEPVSAKSRKIKRYDQTKELGWDEEEKLHVIVKHVFEPEQGRKDVHFYDNLKKDLEPEFVKCGPIQSIKIFERNPEGAVAVKFKNGWAATRCIEVMNGRFFDGRKLEAIYYDGMTNYFTPETEEERVERDALWEKWLQGNEDYEEQQRLKAASMELDKNDDGEGEGWADMK